MHVLAAEADIWAKSQAKKARATARAAAGGDSADSDTVSTDTATEAETDEDWMDRGVSQLYRYPEPIRQNRGDLTGRFEVRVGA